MPGAKVIVEFFDPDVGGRKVTYLTSMYRPHFRVQCGEYLGIAFSGDASSGPIYPGACVPAEVMFLYSPNVGYEDLVVGARFQIMEGARVVGIGVVSELVL
ncbi:hypothetical protein D3C87_772350 [compost metagenome]